MQLALTPTPLANSYPERPYAGEKFPLELMQCLDCGHVQLGHVPDPEELYFDYKYSTPTAVIPHLERYAKDLAYRYPQAKRVLEIGCNNGLFLDVLEKHGFDPLGVDPTATHRNAIQGFFGKDSRPGTFDLIVANNVFAHIDDLEGAFEGVDACLSEDGALVFEVQHLHNLVEGGLFDMIYHEHHDYHSLYPWVSFLKRFGLVVSRAEYPVVHGGSMRLYCERPGIGVEAKQRHVDWRWFKKQIEAGRQRTLGHLESAKRIVLFGAPAKATTLLHHYGITERFAYCVDDTPAKQGRYIPGTGIEIRPTSALKREPPDLLFLAAWNFYDVIQAKYPQYRIAHPFMSPDMAVA